jgi:hypothetical protein
MSKKRFTIIITQGIEVMLLLIVGIGGTSILSSTTHAQSATLGEPYFVEKGMVTTQKEIGPNSTQFTFAANGTMNGDIDVTDTGKFESISKGEPAPGLLTIKHGIITTKHGSEMANYTGIDVGNYTDYQGASAYSTNSSGKLSFLNNMMGVYKGETDESGNFVLREWHWK